MENQDFIKYVYNFIKRSGERFDWMGQFPKPEEIVNNKEYNWLRVSISKYDLPPELEFSKLPLILNELSDYGLIEYNGKMESAKDADNPKKRVPAYWARLIRIEDINEFLKKNGKISEEWFDYRTNSISFGGSNYTPNNTAQGKFIRQLSIRCQKQNKNGDILEKGDRVSSTFLANDAGVTAKEILSIRKQLMRTFKDNKFPLEIDKNSDGILLIYTR